MREKEATKGNSDTAILGKCALHQKLKLPSKASVHCVRAAYAHNVRP